MDYTLIKNWLKENLTEERYLHSLGTAECAAELAEKYGVNKEKAYLAGLIHDCAKCLKNEELLGILHKMENIHEDEFINPKTYHAPAGVPVAKITPFPPVSSSKYLHFINKSELFCASVCARPPTFLIFVYKNKFL